MKKYIYYCLLILFILKTFESYSQVAKQDSIKKNNINNTALKVYIDYNNCYSCDFSFIRKEIKFINYVRDPKESQLHIIIAQTITGSGGSEFTFFFSGNNELKYIKDTIKQTISVNNTIDETRRVIVKVLKFSLMRYVLQTPLKDIIDFNIYIPDSTNEKVEDKWNKWVFNLNLNGYTNGEKSTKYSNLSSYISANKITENIKINFYASNSYSENSFLIGESIYKSSSSSYYLSHSIVKSLNKHWSYGGFYDFTSSTYNNIKFSNSLYAGIEYDIFPYSESISKLLTFRYRVGCNLNEYNDSTIYFKLKENLYLQNISSNLNLIKKWGNVSVGISWSNYLHDFNKNRLSLNSNLNVRLFKGFSFSLSSSVSILHDQLSLSKKGATNEEIFLRQKQLQTQYSYYFSLGVSYTFGSIYNNIVNPRFE